MPVLQIAGLKVHLNSSSISSTGEMKAAVVLLHGFGAPGTDLVSLANSLNVPEGTGFFFPEGPLDLGAQLGAGYGGARAWWPIDMAKLQAAQFAGKVHTAARGLANGLEIARPMIVGLLDELKVKFGVASERIILGGFSQGAVACLDIAVHESRSLAGLLLMSGTMVDPEAIAQLAPRRAGLPAVMSHGRSDPILPYAVAETLQKQLVAANWKLTWVPFSGGHGIPVEVLKAASTEMSRWLA